MLPGFVFQSVVIGGGYATGKELVEFFFLAGPPGGILGMLVSMVIWSVTMAASFELARVTKSYDYRSFFSQTLGQCRILFEIAYFALILLVLSTLGAASGALITENLGISPIWGIAGLMISIGILVFYGSSVIESFLAGWSFLLYGAYAVFVIWCFNAFGDDIVSNFSTYPIKGGWFEGGVSYAGYNLACIPAVIFCTRYITSRKEAVTAGILAGPIAMIPGLLFFTVLIGYYPEITNQQLPVNFLLNALDMPIFKIIFEVILFGTFIETGTAFIHSINERMAEVFEERNKQMPRWMRPGIALGVLFVAIFLASWIGLVDLIANGYGTLTYVFIILIVLPLFTVGIWKINQAVPRTN